MLRPGRMWLCRRGSCERKCHLWKKTHILFLSAFLSNTIYSSLFTVHLPSVSFQTCKCYGAHKAGWATSKILSVEQERETINWYSKQPPPWSGIILALFFSITLSLFFFLVLFSPIRHQSSLATKLGTGLGVGCISYSWWHLVHKGSADDFSEVTRNAIPPT